MLTALFPKYHQRYLECPVADWLAGFADWLVSAGYPTSPQLPAIASRHASVT